MEYIIFLIGVTSVSLLCLFSVRKTSEPEIGRKSSASLAAKAQSTAGEKAGENPKKMIHSSIRSNVPTPWGWPGSQKNGSARKIGQAGANGHSTIHVQDHQGVSETLRQWVDFLISEKQTVADEAYRQRREASMRALLEDRWGKSTSNSRTSEVVNGKVENGKTRSDGRSAAGDGMRTAFRGQLNYGERQEIRTPWGW